MFFSRKSKRRMQGEDRKGEVYGVVTQGSQPADTKTAETNINEPANPNTKDPDIDVDHAAGPTIPGN